MKINRIVILSVVASGVIGTSVLHAAKPGDFSAAQIAEIWTEIWKTTGEKIRAPKIEKLSEQQVIKRMTGKWTVMFGVMPDKLTITVNTNRLVDVSGHKDGKDWKRAGSGESSRTSLFCFWTRKDSRFHFQDRPA